MNTKNEHQIPVITVNDQLESVFENRTFTKENRGGLVISPRIEAHNFRIRESEVGYKANWHVAGDPTFIAIQHGTLRITLRDKSFFNFGPGDSFIAADYLPDGMSFDKDKHGHQAEVIGSELLKAIHIKLEGFNS